MIFAVPLAWLQLTYEKSRLLVAIAGIMFAVILMFMQIGFQDALFRSAVRLQSSLVGDIVLISPQSTNLVGMRNFSQRRLYQAYSIEGVESTNNLYIGLAAWKVKESPTGQTRNILVLGADPAADVFNLKGITRENLDRVKLQDVVLFDRSSRTEFGPIVAECGSEKKPEDFTCHNPVYREVGNRRLQIGSLFSLGSSFAADGALITSETNFLRIFDNRREGLINVGIINLKPGVSKFEVMEKLIALLSGNEVILPGNNFSIDNQRVREVSTDKTKVAIDKTALTTEDIRRTGDVTVDDTRILTMQGFIDFERSYWQKGTAIGFIFTLGTIMGFIVGIVIVYQILYTDVSDHLAEYATLKAMGYSNFFLSKVVLQEAFVLSVLGYIPGFFACVGLYAMTRNATRLPLDMTFERGFQVLLLTIVMCTISGAISLRKVQSADPAEIFG